MNADKEKTNTATVVVKIKVQFCILIFHDHLIRAAVREHVLEEF